ncbi:MAG: hypothetical protein ACQETH_01595 [Candidatus Rifleibacteriota bacterium]
MFKKRILLRISLLIFCLHFFTNLSFAQIQNVAEKPVVIVFQAQRNGDFLAEPGNIPVEFLRRVGRAINKNWPSDKNVLKAASVFDANKLGDDDLLKPVRFSLLTEKQQKEYERLFNRYASDADELLNDIEPGKESIFIRFAGETGVLSKIFEKFLQNEKFASSLKQRQKFKLEHQIIPFLQAADYVTGAMVLSLSGLEFRLRAHSIEGNLASSQNKHQLSIGNFINPESLMAFAQIHPIENPEEIIRQLNAMPQSAALVKTIASAGLDMKKDLISNSARESIFYLNLNPTGENGIPDARFVAPVPDISKLKTNLDKLQNLCSQVGVFVKQFEGKKPTIRLSYFMFPQYGIFAGLEDNFLVLATSKENLLQEMSFIAKVKAGKKEGEQIQQNLKSYWRIGFEDFNLQLQKFLQSPVMVNQGVPPIPNLTFLKDLKDLKILTKLSPEKLDFTIILPIKEKSYN